MRVAVDKTFSPSHPYSKFLVAKLRFAGPVYESKWWIDYSGEQKVAVEEMAETLSL
jgi:hypothetical protein